MTQKIKYVHITNFKGIKDVELSEIGRFVAIKGKNGAGKTSFLDAIKTAIKALPGTSSKVRVGEEQGEIVVEFDEFTIKRIIGEKTKLTIEHDGKVINKPQEYLDCIFKGTIGDPQKFINLHNKEKIKYILETQGKKLQYDEIEKVREVKYEERKNKHRTFIAKREEIDKTDISDFKQLEYATVESIEDLQKELSQVDAHNDKYYELKKDADTKTENVNFVGSKVAEYEGYVNDLKTKLAQAEQELLRQKEAQIHHKHEKDLADQELAKFEKKDNSEILAKIAAINETNQKLADVKARKNLYDAQIGQMEVLGQEYAQLNIEVQDLEAQQNALIKDIKLGYKMELVDGVMYVTVGKDAIPLDELNKAMQLEIGIDICLNGPNEVKIITIEDANTLDPTTLERVKEKIEKFGAQCFLETVYNTGYEAIEIEDGEVLIDKTADVKKK